jgi:molybdopterin molybdotransferase
MALLPVAEARSRIIAGVKPLAGENVPLAEAAGRVLARPVIAKRDQPPFAASAMDGYALRQEDISSIPAVLTVIGTSAAGHAFKRKMKPGTAVRILTGAPLPTEADTIVIQENTERSGETLRILQATPA